jgi:hypothetical protein
MLKCKNGKMVNSYMLKCDGLEENSDSSVPDVAT